MSNSIHVLRLAINPVLIGRSFWELLGNQEQTGSERKQDIAIEIYHMIGITKLNRSLTDSQVRAKDPLAYLREFTTTLAANRPWHLPLVIAAYILEMVHVLILCDQVRLRNKVNWLP
jgi:hypothetical protein